VPGLNFTAAAASIGATQYPPSSDLELAR